MSHLLLADHHPIRANAVLVVFLLWPFALIAYKARHPAVRWSRLWLTVPVASWVLVNLALRLDYPTTGGGGGFGIAVNLALGWFYLLPIFGLLQLGFLFVQRLRRKSSRPA